MRINQQKQIDMFPEKVYTGRRSKLHEMMGNGILLFPGNEESAMNYKSNTYRYRQDSSFLYFFGISKPGFCGWCDVDSGEDRLYGDDFTIDDIIWMGAQPSVKELAAGVGVQHTGSVSDLERALRTALQSGRRVHILPPYRGDHVIRLSGLMGVDCGQVAGHVSEELIRAVVKLRAAKDRYEIEEMERALEVTGMMHITGMKMAFPGNYERDLAGTIEGIALASGGAVSYPVILSMDGQIMHNHEHGNELAEGRIVVCDAGSETEMGYAGDITRSYPVGGKFNLQQKEIYEIVLEANVKTMEASGPGIPYRNIHLMAARIIADGLKALGLMKGDMEEAVAAGAHALFFPHGLGHMIGLDVHDMEGLGENYVGYSDQIKRSDQFGLAYLRMGRELEPGFVVTNEPGCYFIPELIDIWKKEKKFEQFINYGRLDAYRGFGGIRIEDNVLITSDGMRILGTPIPKTVQEVEATMRA